jgi:hypothetical protein
VEAFGGDALSLTRWQFAQALNSQVRVNLFHAGQGTLWTNLDQAQSGLLGAAAWETTQGRSVAEKTRPAEAKP